MRCKKVKEKLSAFIDNELESKIRLKIEQHLTKCFGCEQELKILTQTWQALEKRKRIEASVNFEEKFWQRVRERELKQPLFQRLLTRVIPIPAAFTVLIFGLAGGIYLSKILFPKETKMSSNDLYSLTNENFLYLDNFDDFPPESVGDIYISLTSLRKNSRIED